MDELFHVLDGVFEFTFGSRVERVERAASCSSLAARYIAFAVSIAMSLACSTCTVRADSKLSLERGAPQQKNPDTPSPQGSPDIDWLLKLFHKHGMEMPLP